MNKRHYALGMVVLLLTVFASSSVAQQLTTATLSGVVKDNQGGVLPGASVQLTSETKGTIATPAVTGSQGDFLVVNIAPDTYTVEVQLQGFKTLRRGGLSLSGGDRASLGTVVLELGTLVETITVVAETPFIQAESGERSFTVEPKNRRKSTDRQSKLHVADRTCSRRDGCPRWQCRRGYPATTDRRRRNAEHHDGRRLDDGYRRQPAVAADER
jgi:hypothetical protein